MSDDPKLLELRAQVVELAMLLDLIRLEISQPARRDTENHAKSKISASPAPWNDEAAMLVLEVEAGARDHEQKLARIGYAGFVHRGVTTAGSTLALHHLPDLIMLVRSKCPERMAPGHAEADLRAWGRRSRILLDQARSGDQPWTRAPGGITCIYCNRPLWLEPGWMQHQTPSVFCRVCRDPQTGKLMDWPNLTWLGVVNSA